MIFNFFKKILKKAKYWQSNDHGFKFSPEVKVYPLIDSPTVWYYANNQDDFRGMIQMGRIGYSVDRPPNIFLGVIHLHVGMSKPRPWKCLWTRSYKRKKGTKNENIAMSEQAKVGRKLKLPSGRAMGSSWRKIQWRAEKGTVTIVHVLSGWLASSYSVWHAFLQQIS